MLVPGPEMDRQIARKINGDVKSRPAAYSTNETAARRLLRRLARDGMPSTVELDGGRWYCTLFRGPAGGGERVSSGSGRTRAGAIARAVLNASFDPGTPIRANDTHPILARGLARPPPGRDAPRCRACDVELPLRRRTAVNRYCGVCAWKRIKDRFRPAPRPA
jgi:hypothetical protein